MTHQRKELFRPTEPANDDNSPFWKRLLWFVGISIASGAVVAVVAYTLRGLLFL